MRYVPVAETWTRARHPLDGSRTSINRTRTKETQRFTSQPNSSNRTSKEKQRSPTELCFASSPPLDNGRTSTRKEMKTEEPQRSCFTSWSNLYQSLTQRKTEKPRKGYATRAYHPLDSVELLQSKETQRFTSQSNAFNRAHKERERSPAKAMLHELTTLWTAVEFLQSHTRKGSASYALYS